MHTNKDRRIRIEANSETAETFHTETPAHVPAKAQASAAKPEHFSDEILEQVKQAVGPKRFSLFFAEKVRLTLADDRLTVGVGSPFLASWFLREYRELISTIARSVIGPAIDIDFEVDALLSAQAQCNSLGTTGRKRTAADAKVMATAASVSSSAGKGTTHASVDTAALQLMADLPASLTSKNLATRQNPAQQTGKTHGSERNGVPVTPAMNATAEAVGPSSAVSASVPNRSRRMAELSEFHASPANELALGSARQLASGQPFPFNPLYLYGGVGIGKTHLLEGICRDMRRHRPGWNVQLLSAETFANLFTQALREKTLPGFRQRFRSVDALLIDDVDFFEVTRAIRDEFLHTLRDLLDHGRTVVLAADRHPRLLTNLGDELVTRFLSGLVCRLEAPDLDTRVRIVEAKAAKLTTALAPEAVEFISQRFKTNVRELEGALNCLQAWQQMTGKKVTLTVARQVLGDLERDCLKIIRLADVEQVVCNLFGVKSKELKSVSRARSVSQPRMVAMFLARKHTTAAYTEIGQHFGGRNHSTVMAAERKVTEWLQQGESVRVSAQDWKLEEVIGTLEQQLLAG